MISQRKEEKHNLPITDNRGRGSTAVLANLGHGGQKVMDELVVHSTRVSVDNLVLGLAFVSGQNSLVFANQRFKLFLVVFLALLHLVQLVKLLGKHTLLRNTAGLSIIKKHTRQYKNQTEAELVLLHDILIHLKTMAVLTGTTENFDQQGK